MGEGGKKEKGRNGAGKSSGSTAKTGIVLQAFL